MFFIIPVILIISLIQLAISFQPILIPPYDNFGVAATMVFGFGSFVVAVSAYLSQYFVSVDSKRSAIYHKLGRLIPYIVFVSLILPQSFHVNMIEGGSQPGGGGWLYAALHGLTNGFKLGYFNVEGFNFLDLSYFVFLKNSTHNLYFEVLYYSVFMLYLFLCELFLNKGSKDFKTHLPVDFISITRQGLFGLAFIFLFVFLNEFDSLFTLKAKEIGINSSSDAMKFIVSAVQNSLFLVAPLFFIFFVPLFLPKIAGWVVLPPGEDRDNLMRIAKENSFQFREIYLADKPGLITAGIIGYFRSTRNLVFTSDILYLLSPKEIEAVMLHEIGHAKYKHIFVYYLYLFSLILLITNLSKFTFIFMDDLGEIFLYVLSLVLVIIGIRYGWGWLSRSCERQADLHAAEIQDSPEFIVSSFFKISSTMGNVLDRPSWHHGTLRERITNLLKTFEGDKKSNIVNYHGYIKKIKTLIGLVFLFVFSYGIYNGYEFFKDDNAKIYLLTAKAEGFYRIKNYNMAEINYLKAVNLFEQKKENDKSYVFRLVVNKYNLACTYALNGKKENAIKQLQELLPLLTEELVLQGRPDRLDVEKFNEDPDFHLIRDSEEFSNIVQQVQTIESAFLNKEKNPFSPQ